MAYERDYANDYDAWLAEQGGDPGYGNTIPTDQNGDTVAPPPPAAPPPQDGPGNQWGLSPNDNPGPGMDNDLWYWLNHGVTPQGNDQSIFDANGQLRPGWRRTANGYERDPAPTSTNTPYPNYPTTYSPYTPRTTSGYSSNLSGGGGFAWPQFNAPNYTPGPAFVAPPAFSYEAYKQPEFSDIYKDGSYAGRRDEGLNAIEHGAAAKGLTRLPATLKALGSWNQDFASREYGNIADRAANTWQMNRSNAADAYSLNYGISRDVWDRGEQQNLNKFDRDYKSAYDSFDFNEYRPSVNTFDDMFRRYKAELDATTALAGYGANG